jgi:hypothetical protein
MKKEISPAAVIGIIVVVLAIVVVFGYKAMAPAPYTPSPGVPGVGGAGQPGASMPGAPQNATMPVSGGSAHNQGGAVNNGPSSAGGSGGN